MAVRLSAQAQGAQQVEASRAVYAICLSATILPHYILSAPSHDCAAPFHCRQPITSRAAVRLGAAGEECRRVKLQLARPGSPHRKLSPRSPPCISHLVLSTSFPTSKSVQTPLSQPVRSTLGAVLPLGMPERGRPHGKPPSPCPAMRGRERALEWSPTLASREDRLRLL